MSRSTVHPYFVIFVDKLKASPYDDSPYHAECPELGLETWGRNEVHAEERLGEMIRERLIEVMRKE